MLKQIKINTCPFFPFITLSPVLRGKCFHNCPIVAMGQKNRDDTDTGMRAPASGESKQRDADMHFR